jgi:DNA-directed RNA polymerase subunit RPC12/RpoP
MITAIVGCPQCKAAFFLPGIDDYAHTPCPQCHSEGMVVLEDDSVLDCGQCQMPTNAITYQMHGNLKRIKPGALTCKYCSQSLLWKQ